MRSTNAVKPIESWQRRSIFAYAKELGIKVDNATKNDALHDLAESVTGKRSISKLGFYDAQKVIDRLKENLRGFERFDDKPKQSNVADRWNQYGFGLPTRSGMASPAQLEFLRALMFELKNRDPSHASLDDRLRGWLEKYAHTSDVKFLTPATAWKAIEGLKKYLKKLGWEYKD